MSAVASSLSDRISRAVDESFGVAPPPPPAPPVSLADRISRAVDESFGVPTGDPFGALHARAMAQNPLPVGGLGPNDAVPTPGVQVRQVGIDPNTPPAQMPFAPPEENRSVLGEAWQGFKQGAARALPKGAPDLIRPFAPQAAQDLELAQDIGPVGRPAEGAGGFVGETIGGMAGGLLNPQEAPANVVGMATGAGAVEAAGPLLRRIAVSAGPKIASVVQHAIGGAGGMAPIGAFQRAAQISHEQWAADPLGSLMEVLKAGGVAGATGGVIGGVSGIAGEVDPRLGTVARRFKPTSSSAGDVSAIAPELRRSYVNDGAPETAVQTPELPRNPSVGQELAVRPDAGLPTANPEAGSGFDSIAEAALGRIGRRRQLNPGPVNDNRGVVITPPPERLALPDSVVKPDYLPESVVKPEADRLTTPPEVVKRDLTTERSSMLADERAEPFQEPPQAERQPEAQEYGQQQQGEGLVRAGGVPHEGESTAPTKHEFSSTQFDLPEEHAAAVREAAARIPDSDLAGDGRETDPHVTVKYGLHADNPEAVRSVIESTPPFKVKLGKTSLFKNGAEEVVKADVEGPELHALNKRIADAAEHTDTHPTYKPHVTLAYVKKGAGDRYAGDTSLAGREIVVDHVTFSGKDGETTQIPLRGRPRGMTAESENRGHSLTDSRPQIEPSAKRNPAEVAAKASQNDIEAIKGEPHDFTQRRAIDSPDPTEPQGPVTSARNAMMEEDRKALGLDALDGPERRSWQAALDTAVSRGEPERALRTAAEVNAKPRSLNDIETAGLVHKANSLKGEHRAIMAEIDTLKDPADIRLKAAEAARVADEFDTISTALRHSGTETGRSLASRKLTIDQDYSLVAIKSRAKAAKGAELTPAENARYEAMSKQLEELTAKHAELEKRVAEDQAERAIKRHSGRRRADPKAREAEFTDLLAQAKNLLEKGCN